MPTASATNRKISWLKREDDGGTLDLSPAFQRRPVWTDEQSAYLIDTVMLGLPFPEVYLRSKTTEDGVTTHQVVDGQQRIRALLRFGRNDLTLEGPEVSASLQGLRFEDLSPDQKRGFWEYEVVTRDLSNASDTEVRDIFRRLNIGAVNLNDQELRHAKYKGQFIKLMEELADDEWWTDMRVVSVKQVRRMEDVEFVSELFVAMMAGPQDKKRTLEQYYEDFENDFPDRDRWARSFRDTRSLLEGVMDAAQIRAWSGRSDFYSLFTVLSTHITKKIRWSVGQRDAVSRRLARFRKDVDIAKRKDNTKKFSADVHAYADAVTRAASDIARRMERGRILGALIERARD